MPLVFFAPPDLPNVGVNQLHKCETTASGSEVKYLILGGWTRGQGPVKIMLVEGSVSLAISDGIGYSLDAFNGGSYTSDVGNSARELRN